MLNLYLFASIDHDNRQLQPVLLHLLDNFDLSSRFVEYSREKIHTSQRSED